MNSLPQRPQLISSSEYSETFANVRLLMSTPEELLERQPLWPGTEAAALAGFQVDDNQAAFLQQLRSAVDALGQSGKVWMDTTTVFRASRLLSGDPQAGRSVFDPLALLDLDTFIRCFILYDQVLYAAQDPRDPMTDLRPVNEQLHEPVFVPLLGEIDEIPRSTNQLFDHIYARARFWLEAAIDQTRTDEQFARWRATVHDVFGIVPDERALRRLVHGWGSNPVYVSRLLLEAGDAHAGAVWGVSGEMQQRLVGDVSARHVFNHLLSRALGLPYHPAAARMPTAAAYAAGRGLAATDALHAAMQELRSERLTRLRRFDIDVEAAPVWAAVLLARVSTAADLWAELVALREETARLRASRAHFEREVERQRETGGDEHVLDEMLQALRAERERLWTSWAGVVAPVAFGLLAEALIGLGALAYASGVIALLGASLLSSDPSRLRARLLRPRQIVLSDLGSSVKHLNKSLPKAGTIWHLTDDMLDRQAQALARMSHLKWV